MPISVPNVKWTLHLDVPNAKSTLHLVQTFFTLSFKILSKYYPKTAFTIAVASIPSKANNSSGLPEHGN